MDLGEIPLDSDTHMEHEPTQGGAELIIRATGEVIGCF